MQYTPENIKAFMDANYKHFNSATVVQSAKAYAEHIASGGKMMVTLAGAMSTAELGISLAEMIRQGKVHAITCTGANLEEDLFKLVAYNHYHSVGDWRNLSAEDDEDLLAKGFRRVTDFCIPEEEAFRKVEGLLLGIWQEADSHGVRKLPHEFLFDLLDDERLQAQFEGPPENSWLIAAKEHDVPIFVPGWEDCTLGNIFTSYGTSGELKLDTVLDGKYYLRELCKWYTQTTLDVGDNWLAEAKEMEFRREVVQPKTTIGFFQIGGGIAGDFPICVVPSLHYDLGIHSTQPWAYFCQISDAVTSYGGYSGAPPNEKITWGKLTSKTPRFMIESDATIVAPLIFNYVLGS